LFPVVAILNTCLLQAVAAAALLVGAAVLVAFLPALSLLRRRLIRTPEALAVQVGLRGLLRPVERTHP